MSGLHACGSWRADQRFTGGQARDRCYCTTRYLAWGRRWPLSPSDHSAAFADPAAAGRGPAAHHRPRARGHHDHTAPIRPRTGRHRESCQVAALRGIPLRSRVPYAREALDAIARRVVSELDELRAPGLKTDAARGSE
jgi:hypothetical protein